MHRQQLRNVRELDDRREIALRIERQLAVEARRRPRASSPCRRAAYSRPAAISRPCSEPTMPPPPARLSTMTGCFHASFRRCAMLRASRSVEPPAANGTTMRTSFDGYAASAADAESAGDAHESVAATDMTRPARGWQSEAHRDSTLARLAWSRTGQCRAVGTITSRPTRETRYPQCEHPEGWPRRLQSSRATSTASSCGSTMHIAWFTCASSERTRSTIGIDAQTNEDGPMNVKPIRTKRDYEAALKEIEALMRQSATRRKATGSMSW